MGVPTLRLRPSRDSVMESLASTPCPSPEPMIARKTSSLYLWEPVPRPRPSPLCNFSPLPSMRPIRETQEDDNGRSSNGDDADLHFPARNYGHIHESLSFPTVYEHEQRAQNDYNITATRLGSPFETPPPRCSAKERQRPPPRYYIPTSRALFDMAGNSLTPEYYAPQPPQSISISQFEREGNTSMARVLPRSTHRTDSPTPMLTLALSDDTIEDEDENEDGYEDDRTERKPTTGVHTAKPSFIQRLHLFLVSVCSIRSHLRHSSTEEAVSSRSASPVYEFDGVTEPVISPVGETPPPLHSYHKRS